MNGEGVAVTGLYMSSDDDASASTLGLLNIARRFLKSSAGTTSPADPDPAPAPVADAVLLLLIGGGSGCGVCVVSAGSVCGCWVLDREVLVVYDGQCTHIMQGVKGGMTRGESQEGNEKRGMASRG